jgi:hypothetical protein
MTAWRRTNAYLHTPCNGKKRQCNDVCDTLLTGHGRAFAGVADVFLPSGPYASSPFVAAPQVMQDESAATAKVPGPHAMLRTCQPDKSLTGWGDIRASPETLSLPQPYTWQTTTGTHVGD